MISIPTTTCAQRVLPLKKMQSLQFQEEDPKVESSRQAKKALHVTDYNHAERANGTFTSTPLLSFSYRQEDKEKKRNRSLKEGRERNKVHVTSHMLTCSVSSNWLSGLINSTGPAAHSSS